jgi:hypothetical protein
MVIAGTTLRPIRSSTASRVEEVVADDSSMAAESFLRVSVK